MTVVAEAFDVGETVAMGGFGVTIDSVDLLPPWPTRSVFMGPVTISWKVPEAGSAEGQGAAA